MTNHPDREATMSARGPIEMHLIERLQREARSFGMELIGLEQMSNLNTSKFSALSLPEAPPSRDDAGAVSAALRVAREAIRALLTMSDTAKPTKLDAALPWRDNDLLARSMAEDALAAIDALAKGGA